MNDINKRISDVISDLLLDISKNYNIDISSLNQRYLGIQPNRKPLPYKKKSSSVVIKQVDIVTGEVLHKVKADIPSVNDILDDEQSIDYKQNVKQSEVNKFFKNN